MFNVCEDSLLATPLIIDLAILAELFTRSFLSLLFRCVANAVSQVSLMLPVTMVNIKECTPSSACYLTCSVRSFLIERNNANTLCRGTSCQAWQRSCQWSRSSKSRS